MITQYLKTYTYLKMLDVADHLNIEPKMLNIEGSTGLVFASKVIQDLTITSVLVPGTLGNSIKVQYVDEANAGEELASMSESGVLTVKIKAGVSTAAQVKAAIEADYESNRWVSVSVSGTGSNAQSAQALTALASGADATGFDAKLYRRVVRLMNSVAEWFEQMIDGPVLSREFVGYYDGSNSNVIKPRHYPVTAITSIKIDYNRQFPDVSALNGTQYFLRGSEDVKQVKGDVELRLKGSDVVLRDDNETFIVGRIFSGSVLGSIELKYIAGLGTATTMPGDLYQASLQLLEYWFFQRENRDLAISSKGVRGESYTKLKDGIPSEITEVAESYRDVSFANAPVPQRNYFKT